MNNKDKIKKCKYCDYENENSQKVGGHIASCKENPNYQSRIGKLIIASSGRKLSDDTKSKISASRIKYLKENPDKVPYRLNHSSKESYPESYFNEVFINANLSFERYYYFGVYELDFCIVDRKIDIEIDGSQHKYDIKVINSDERRNKYLEENGWDIIRIDWKNYQKLNKEDKEKYISDLINYINNIIIEKPTIEINERIESWQNYCICGEVKSKKANICIKCTYLNYNLSERPKYCDLIKDVEEFGYLKTGRKYKVSDNTIRKWIKKYKKEEIVS